ncbi:hypothetical protein BJ979_001620 [Schumannella luteola]|uniref:Uncharacterized protein n=1 Tax=Schumannella luteola TaxID=472059 RepID=A0A852YCI9_9MICO|nr:hypothetical protein [Schumannella luteola]
MAADDREDLGQHLRPLTDDAVVAGADAQIAERRESRVPTAIAFSSFRGGMPFVAVKFDDEPISDQQIHSTDAVDRDLQSRANAGSDQAESRQGLDA